MSVLSDKQDIRLSPPPVSERTSRRIEFCRSSCPLRRLHPFLWQFLWHFPLKAKKSLFTPVRNPLIINQLEEGGQGGIDRSLPSKLGLF